MVNRSQAFLTGRWLFVSLIILLLAACASAPKRQSPLPEELSEKTTVLGHSDLRHWSNVPPPGLDAWLAVSDEERRKTHGGIMDREHHYLALSGGGENGAFCAGLLAGWTAAGTRPEFTFVTGISTGALIAPFAFLGPDYDDEVKEVYTNYATEDLVSIRKARNVIFNDAIGESTPMQGIIKRYITAEVMAKIAYEHRKGRILMIGTTNIDASRAVTWDITKIAASGEPGSLELIRKVMLASSSIPVGFPPVIIDVEANGQSYQEMHVDGGVTMQAFIYPLGLNFSQLVAHFYLPSKPEVYVIRNGQIDPRWETVERKILPLAGRSISSLIRTQSIGDLYRMYIASQRDGLNFHLAYIPAHFGDSLEKRSGIEYMKSLYQFAFDQAKAGYPWEKAPPGLE